MMKKPLPVGVDNFKKMMTEGYCYIDKTMMIKELLDLKGEVSGKTAKCGSELDCT